MKNYYNKKLFIVNRSKGNTWDMTKPLREQKGWDEHAAYMDQLTEDGIIVLGGPLEEPGSSMLIIDAADDAEVKDILKQDNWSRMSILVTKDIKPWTILLQSEK